MYIRLWFVVPEESIIMYFYYASIFHPIVSMLWTTETINLFQDGQTTWILSISLADYSYISPNPLYRLSFFYWALLAVAMLRTIHSENLISPMHKVSEFGLGLGFYLG